MKIRIEKKDDKFLILLAEEKDVFGKYLTKSELKQLKNNIDQILEYDTENVGDSI